MNVDVVVPRAPAALTDVIPASNSSRGVADIDSSHVHKVHAENVWLRDILPRQDQGIQAAYAIPIGSGKLRLVDLLEVQRQAGIAAIYQYLGPTATDIFVLNSIGLHLDSSRERLDRGSGRGIVYAQITDVIRGGNRIRSLEQSFLISAESGTLARGQISASFVQADVYTRLRHISPTQGDIAPPVSPRVALREPLLVDRQDPILRDHDSDHLTAMALACAITSVAGRIVPESELVALHMGFTSYLELEPTPLLEMSVDGANVSGQATQTGRVRASFGAQIGRLE